MMGLTSATKILSVDGVKKQVPPLGGLWCTNHTKEKTGHFGRDDVFLVDGEQGGTRRGRLLRSNGGASFFTRPWCVRRKALAYSQRYISGHYLAAVEESMKEATLPFSVGKSSGRRYIMWPAS
jgi:hypothetical protein